MIKQVTKDTFSNETKEGLVFVDFWAPWCGPCKMISPILDEIDSEFGDKVKIVKVNVDEESDLAGKFQIMSIPTIVVLKNNEIVDQKVGMQPKESLVSVINNHN